MDNFVAMVHSVPARHEISGEPAHQPDWTEMNHRIKCPQCGEGMDTHPYGGGDNVIIEDCGRCSLNWLDYGELERIVQAPDREYASDV